MSASPQTDTAPSLDPVTTMYSMHYLTVVFEPPAGPAPLRGSHQLKAARLELGREPADGGWVLADSQASRRHCAVEYDASVARYRLSDLGSKNGTYLDGVRIEQPEVLFGGGVIRVGETILVYSELQTPIGIPRLEIPAGASAHLAFARHVVDLAAAGEEPVLIVGPTGAGKEGLARRVHEASGRPGPFVAVNCATFNRELIASELFGHVRGAFSGAQASRAGLFVAAERGTLFLDEVADLPPDVQPALLRALQEKLVRPVGADREVRVDARIVSATHRDLAYLEREGLFRGDLLGRLAGVCVSLPGLAVRREEIIHAFRGALGPTAPPLSVAAAEALLAHDWPYNFREVQSAAASARMFAKAVPQILPTLLPVAVQRSLRERSGPRGETGPLGRDELAALLREYGGNVSKVAEAVGVSRQKVYRQLKAYRLDPDTIRS